MDHNIKVATLSHFCLFSGSNSSAIQLGICAMHYKHTHIHTDRTASNPCEYWKVLGDSGVLYFYLTGLGGSKDG